VDRPGDWQAAVNTAAVDFAGEIRGIVDDAGEVAG
jgi:hypothetical protein